MSTRSTAFVTIILLALLLAAALPGAAAALISTGDGAWVWQNPLPQGTICRA